MFSQQLHSDGGQDRICNWSVAGQTWDLGRFPLLLGILNVTPDSFSDGGQFAGTSAAIEHGLALVEQGADIIDVGGESTRPQAAAVDLEEELKRVIPVIRGLVERTSTPLSIDTTKALVAREALAAGAKIVNDISGLQFDREMPGVCAETDAGVICMHIQGTPQNMQVNPVYADVVGEVCKFLESRLKALEREGIRQERVAIDPGIGFGKTAQHNLAILSHIGRFRALGRPVCIGHSRKRFIQKILGRPVDERLFGTVGISLALAMQSTDMLRVHDVAATRDALLAWKAVCDAQRTDASAPAD